MFSFRYERKYTQFQIDTKAILYLDRRGIERGGLETGWPNEHRLALWADQGAGYFKVAEPILHP